MEEFIKKPNRPYGAEAMERVIKSCRCWNDRVRISKPARNHFSPRIDPEKTPPKHGNKNKAYVAWHDNGIGAIMSKGINDDDSFRDGGIYKKQMGDLSLPNPMKAV